MKNICTSKRQRKAIIQFSFCDDGVGLINNETNFSYGKVTLFFALTPNLFQQKIDTCPNVFEKRILKDDDFRLKYSEQIQTENNLVESFFQAHFPSLIKIMVPDLNRVALSYLTKTNINLKN